MSLRKRYALLTMLFIVLLGSIFVFVRLTREEVRINRRRAQHDWKELGLLFQSQQALLQIEWAIANTGSAVDWPRLANATQHFHNLSEELWEHANDSPSDGPGETIEIQSATNLLTLAGRLRKLAATTPPTEQDGFEAMHREATELLAQAARSSRDFFDGAWVEFSSAQHEIRESEVALENAILRATTAIVLLLIIAWGAFSVWLVRPLDRLHRLVREFGSGAGDLRDVPGVNSRTEVGDLTRSFVAMAQANRYFTDDLEKRVAERTLQLEQSERRLRELLDRLPDALALVDPAGVPLACNARYRELMQGEEKSPLGRLMAEPPTPAGYHPWTAPNEERRLLVIERLPLDPRQADDVGDSSLVLEYIRDVTRQQALEALLARSHRLAGLGRLSAGIAHEINNPLTSIAFCAEGLLKRLSNQPPLEDSGTFRDYLTTIRDEVFRCKEITEKLLDLARPREDKPSEVEMSRYVEDLARLVHHMAEQRGVQVETEAAAGISSVTPPRALRQIGLNLVLNAIEACGSGGRVVLRALRGVDGAVLVQVQDNGCGIAPNDLEHLFEPFFTRRPDGVGLGLFVCQSLAEALGGRLEAQSGGTGLGSTFTLVLPPSASVA